VSGELDMLVEQHLGPVMDDWDIEGLAHDVAHLGIMGEGIDAESLLELTNKDEIIDRLQDAAEATLAERQARYGEQTWAMVERLVLLRSIDQLWVDHLTELDDFRRGVGLRGYGGTDPLVEFKREAFKLYDELRGFIRHQVASTIYRVNVQVQQPASATPPPARSLPMPTPQQMAMLRAAAAARARQAELAAGQTAAGAADGAVQSGDIVTTDDAITETLEGSYGGDDVLADLDLDAEDLAPYDEIEDDTAAPGFVSDENATSADAVTGAAAAAAPVAAQPIIPGLTAKAPRQMTLQHGDEPIAAKPVSAAAAGDPGARLGRNDPCYCGSGLKYKKCHGR
jgi:preprotein translocase subunit SecA